MKTVNKKVAMYQKIEQHGNNLNAIFNTGIDSVKLCKALLRLERKAHHAATCLCNTNTLHLLELNKYTGHDVQQATEEQQDLFFESLLNKVYKLIKPTEEQKKAIFINHDPRGYALKIKREYVRENNITIHTDFGGDGILAPDYNN